RNPKPETRNPKPESRNPKPETRNPKPETRNPKPETRDPKPETRIRIPNPESRIPKPETHPSPSRAVWTLPSSLRTRVPRVACMTGTSRLIRPTVGPGDLPRTSWQSSLTAWPLKGYTLHHVPALEPT
ncbi:hypothetical protein T484DRAFT_1623160, partial [Baffinella frigidus]